MTETFWMVVRDAFMPANTAIGRLNQRLRDADRPACAHTTQAEAITEAERLSAATGECFFVLKAEFKVGRVPSPIIVQQLKSAAKE